MTELILSATVVLVIVVCVVTFVSYLLSASKCYGG